MKQVTVLHVIDHVGIGGAQRIIGELLSKWNKKSIKLVCYALRASSNNFDHSNKQVFFSSNHKSKYNVFSFFELKKFIETEDIKILHLHLPKSIIFGVLLKMFYCKDVKIIAHEHGKIFQNNFWYNYFLKIFQDKIDLFIAVSEATKRMLIKNAKITENKIKVLYNFVDLNKFNPDKNYDKTIERRKVGINEDDFVIGFVGRLSKIKGCDLLIKSIPYIDNIQKIKVLIAGDGIERRKLEKLSGNLDIEDKIIFLGFVKDILNFYKVIDILVVPSRSESFSLSAIEAQALGVSVIATSIDGLNEVVLDKKTGLLFEPKNEKDLAEKIMLLYTDKKLKEDLNKNALENIKKYNFENYLEKLNLLYRRFSRNNVLVLINDGLRKNKLEEVWIE